MTEQQFKYLRAGDNIKHHRGFLTVYQKDIEEGIIFINKDGSAVRYENCELVERDELVEYLKNMSNTPSIDAEFIRQIVRKEIIDSLKVPTYEDLRVKCNPYITQSFFDWFIAETKRLNS